MEFVTIGNEQLRVVTNSVGAVLHSVCSQQREFLWQGDPAYWSRRDSTLFPYAGRLTDGIYRCEGKTYSFPNHGFCIGRDFEVTAADPQHVRYSLYSSEETLAMYPFDFAFHVDFTVSGSGIFRSFTVENTGKKTMFFGLGAHPGFFVPPGGAGSFEDCYLEFPEPCKPVRVGLHPETFLLNGEDVPFPTEDGCRIPLRHEMFDRGAVFLKNIPQTLCLRSRCDTASVTVNYPQMPYIVLWQKPRSDAPYLCMEPWASLPSRHGVVEELDRQPGLIRLEPGGTSRNTVSISVNT